MKVYVHKLILFEKIGPGTHPCHWCQRPLEWQNGTAWSSLLADHLNGDKHDNSPENLVPACNGCNTIRGRVDFRPQIADDELFVMQKDGTRTRAAYLKCEVCGVDFLASLTRIRNGTVSLCSKRCNGIRGSERRWKAA